MAKANISSACAQLFQSAKDDHILNTYSTKSLRERYFVLTLIQTQTLTEICTHILTHTHTHAISNHTQILVIKTHLLSQTTTITTTAYFIYNFHFFSELCVYVGFKGFCSCCYCCWWWCCRRQIVHRR